MPTTSAAHGTKLKFPASLARNPNLGLVIALAALAALGLAFRAGALDLPLDRDEGAYAYIGSKLIHGTVPYRDAFDHKPPGVYFFYALATLGPDTVTGIRLATAA